MQPMDTEAVERALGYVFRDKQLLVQAFTHRSYLNEHKSEVQSQNERLEFLGDAVLSLIVSTHLYERRPEVAEGTLSSLRSSLVDAHRCVAYLRRLAVDDHLLLGKGEQMNLGKGREGILADLFEALLGAIYLDGGLSAAEEFFFGHFQKEIETGLAKPPRNWKAELQDYTQKHLGAQPHYEVLEAKGPDHAKEFLVAVYVGEEKKGEGRGNSKKQATQNAAKAALDQIW